jgi:hypothetical protein
MGDLGADAAQTETARDALAHAAVIRSLERHHAGAKRGDTVSRRRADIGRHEHRSALAVESAQDIGHKLRAHRPDLTTIAQETTRNASTSTTPMVASLSPSLDPVTYSGALTVHAP